MKRSNLVPLLFLFGGLAGALYISWLTFTDPSTERAVPFAIASLVAVLGWRELRADDAADDLNEALKGE